MSTKKFSEMTTEELLKSQKMSKTATYSFAVILLLLCIVNIYLVFKKGFSASQVVPIALLPLLVLNFKTLKDIKEELKSREK
ncbi:MULTISPECIES: redox-active disulfide protein 2 [unclassified Flavobacterium]|uniref:redox-active disulfide protein 2 n=1 Tax=unclassified Flavobacterium TaxID=196869 RepID=UPI00222280C7|nr:MULTISPECIES: redox-active disulfide protein 2 [unclassified Flavobacterium]